MRRSDASGTRRAAGRAALRATQSPSGAATHATTSPAPA
jgi:hypothetical protein